MYLEGCGFQYPLGHCCLRALENGKEGDLFLIPDHTRTEVQYVMEGAKRTFMETGI